MLRRRFLQLIASASSVAALPGLASESAKTATYHVKGFSCPTCATGLDTMLGQQRGIVSSKSTYPEGLVKVSYRPEKITEEWIVAFITDMGFQIEKQGAGSPNRE
jgi:copper chaperone CopZ